MIPGCENHHIRWIRFIIVFGSVLQRDSLFFLRKVYLPNPIWRNSASVIETGTGVWYKIIGIEIVSAESENCNADTRQAVPL
jgi:hypothetical protein